MSRTTPSYFERCFSVSGSDAWQTDSHPLNFIRAAEAVMKRVGHDVITDNVRRSEIAAAKQVLARSRQYADHIPNAPRLRVAREALAKFWRIANG